MTSPTNIIDSTDVSENPALTSMIETQLNDRLLEEELEDSLIEQYKEHKNHGYNFLNDYDDNVITPNILVNMMEYIDDNTLGIEYRYQIADHDKNTYILIKMLYETLFVDMVKFILPSVMKNIESNDPNDIKRLEASDLRFQLVKVAKDTLEGLHKSREYGDGSNQKVAREIVKYSYCLDLFDADLEDFLENFIIPVVNNYNSVIHSADV